MSHPLVSAMGMAWDGAHDARQRRALCVLGNVDPDHAARAWRELSPEVRERLLGGLRSGIELGAICSRVVLSLP